MIACSLDPDGRLLDFLAMRRSLEGRFRPPVLTPLLLAIRFHVPLSGL